jgi:hypothetical protein
MAAAVVDQQGQSTRELAPRKGWIDHWDPDDPEFWDSTGRGVARRNLVLSILAEHLGFSVWVLWSIVAVNLDQGPRSGRAAHRSPAGQDGDSRDTARRRGRPGGGGILRRRCRHLGTIRRLVDLVRARYDSAARRDSGLATVDRP